MKGAGQSAGVKEDTIGLYVRITVRSQCKGIIIWNEKQDYCGSSWIESGSGHSSLQLGLISVWVMLYSTYFVHLFTYTRTIRIIV